MDITTSLESHGGIAQLNDLTKDGVTAAQRTAAIAEGRLIRVRNGWFALPNAPANRVRAVRIGGRLSCVSALADHGLWVMPDERLHVSVAPYASRLKSPHDRHVALDTADPSIVVHWGGFDGPTGNSIDTVAHSVAQLMLCTDRLSALVAIESALHLKKLSMLELTAIVAQLPPSYGWFTKHARVTSHSGLETIGRVRLRGRGLRVRNQVTIPGVGTVDILVGDRLIIELDSRSHHLGKNYEKDRTRDLHAIDRGYLVLRVSHYRVMNDWQSIEDVVLRLARRREHEWRGMHYRLGLARRKTAG